MPKAVKRPERMRGLLKGLFSAHGAAPAKTLPRQLRLADMPPLTYAVGDVHGHLDLYRKLEAQIIEEAAGQPILIVLLGDLVDRGPDSAGLIDLMMARAPAGVQRLVLMGNHENMFLKFLTNPAKNMNWISYGGRETLASYGIYGDPTRGFDLPEKRLLQMIESSVPLEHIDWLRGLPGALYLGPRFFLSHSGIDPAKPLEAQTTRDLMWSRGMVAPPPEGVTVIHGHTPIEVVDARGPYINLDTGAYETGRLSALRLIPEVEPAVLDVKSEHAAALRRSKLSGA
jgi:serine/threonine protein phosphatase 1